MDRELVRVDNIAGSFQHLVEVVIDLRDRIVTADQLDLRGAHEGGLSPVVRDPGLNGSGHVCDVVIVNILGERFVNSLGLRDV